MQVFTVFILSVRVWVKRDLSLSRTYKWTLLSIIHVPFGNKNPCQNDFEDFNQNSYFSQGKMRSSPPRWLLTRVCTVSFVWIISQEFSLCIEHVVVSSYLHCSDCSGFYHNFQRHTPDATPPGGGVDPSWRLECINYFYKQ